MVLWIAVGIAIVVFLVADALIYWHGRKTMSQTSQGYFHLHRLALVIAAALIGLGSWHLLHGFPW